MMCIENIFVVSRSSCFTCMCGRTGMRRKWEPKPDRHRCFQWLLWNSNSHSQLINATWCMLSSGDNVLASPSPCTIHSPQLTSPEWIVRPKHHSPIHGHWCAACIWTGTPTETTTCARYNVLGGVHVQRRGVKDWGIYSFISPFKQKLLSQFWIGRQYYWANKEIMEVFIDCPGKYPSCNGCWAPV